MDVVGKKLHLY